MSGVRYLEEPGRFMVAICGLKTSDLGDISAAISRISDFPARINLLKNLIKSTDDFFAFGKLCAKFGDKGVDVLDSLRRIAENTAEYGAEAAECALRALADVADESVVIDALKASDKLDECIEGLAIVAKSGLGPADIAAVFKNHANILSAAYTSEKLLLDVKVLGKIPGMDHLWKMLKTNNTNTKGFRYELEGGAWLRRSGNNVVELSTDVSVALQTGAKSVNTDIDVVVLLNNMRIYYQFKRSRDALRNGKKGLDNAKLWVSKAFKDLGAGATFDQIKYAVPPGVSIPPQISAFLNSLIPPIKVERIPHLE